MHPQNVMAPQAIRSSVLAVWKRLNMEAYKGLGGKSLYVDRSEIPPVSSIRRRSGTFLMHLTENEPGSLSYHDSNSNIKFLMQK